VNPHLELHAVEPRSRANGPGARFVLWFQGCSLGCPGCFNPATHPRAAQLRWTVAEAMAQIAAEGDRIEGVTLSGGEPLEQPEAALALVRAVRAETSLSVLVFSGFAIDEIRTQPLGPAILDELDVLIDGRYRAPERLGRGLRGSENQRVQLLSGRYTRAEVEATPEAEVRIAPDGSVVLTGVSPLRLK
jgi:anaerobic ribonucleoside-triphosphate reductase activating protein